MRVVHAGPRNDCHCSHNLEEWAKKLTCSVSCLRLGSNTPMADSVSQCCLLMAPNRTKKPGVRLLFVSVVETSVISSTGKPCRPLPQGQTRAKTIHHNATTNTNVDFAFRHLLIKLLSLPYYTPGKRRHRIVSLRATHVLRHGSRLPRFPALGCPCDSQT